MEADLPAYFEPILDAYNRGLHNRSVHLGYYASDPDPSGIPLHEAQKEFDSRLLNIAGLRGGLRILDVGCGLGGLIDRINSECKQVDILGCNIDPRQLEICNSIRPKNDNAIAWMESDASTLPVPSHTMDLVLCIEAAFHFQSRQEFYAEAFRVLKPGGRLICTDIFLKERLLRELHFTESVPQVSLIEEFDNFLHRSVHTLLLSGYAPWPDPWYSATCLKEDLADLGFVSLLIEDWTRATAPSYDAMIPAAKHFGARGTSDPLLGALLTLGFLHQKQLLDYVMFTSLKPT